MPIIWIREDMLPKKAEHKPKKKQEKEAVVKPEPSETINEGEKQ